MWDLKKLPFLEKGNISHIHLAQSQRHQTFHVPGNVACHKGQGKIKSMWCMSRTVSDPNSFQTISMEHALHNWPSQRSVAPKGKFSSSPKSILEQCHLKGQFAVCFSVA